MRKRDLAILMLSAFAIFFSLQVFCKCAKPLVNPSCAFFLFFLFVFSLLYLPVVVWRVINSSLVTQMQHEGDFSFKEAWFHLSDDYPIKYEADRLPPPIVADLNGDGKKEVLVATHDAKIQVPWPGVLFSNVCHAYVNLQLKLIFGCG